MFLSLFFKLPRVTLLYFFSSWNLFFLSASSPSFSSLSIFIYCLQMRSPPPLSPRNSFSTCITHPRLLRSHFSIQHFWPCCLVPKWRTIWLSSPNRAGLQHSQCIHQQVLAFCSLNSSQGPSFNGGCELKITRLVLLADSMHELAFELPPVLLLLWWPL